MMVMSNIKKKDLYLNKIKSKFKEGELSYDIKNLINTPIVCLKCKSEEISYWDETLTEIIFKCKNCKRYYTILLIKGSFQASFSF
jgi:transposase-like protein